MSRDAVSIASDLELELGCGAYRPPKADCRRFNGSLSVAALGFSEAWKAVGPDAAQFTLEIGCLRPAIRH